MTNYVGGASELLMEQSIAEKAAACKDGGAKANARLSELVEAFDRLGFCILRAETNGLDFDLKIRDFKDGLEDGD